MSPVVKAARSVSEVVDSGETMVIVIVAIVFLLDLNICEFMPIFRCEHFS